MRPNFVAPCMMVLTLGLLGMTDGATAGNTTGLPKNESDTINSVVTRTFGWSRYYGRPIYRCRRFSSECNYYRPVHYVRHWSYSNWTNHRNRQSGTVRLDSQPAKLGHYYIDSKTLNSGIFTKPQNARNGVYGGRKVAANEESGGFVRISSPGRSTRWVRADSLSANRPEKPRR